MRIIFTLVGLLFSQAMFSQQTFFVKQTGGGSQDGSSWENASADLASIIDGAKPGDAVWVSAGTYQGGFIMKEGVSVFGGFSGEETEIAQRLLPGTNKNLTILDGNSNFRVLTQNANFTTPSVWDGFIIQNGSSSKGAGVFLKKNGIIRRCIIKNNLAGFPSVGDYMTEEGGVIFNIDKEARRAWVIAEGEQGRTYTIGLKGVTNFNNIEDAIKDTDGKMNSALISKSRAVVAMKAYRGGNRSDWYIPSVGEWSWLIGLNEDKSGFSKTKAFNLVEAALIANGKTPLTGKRYWASTTAENNNMWAAWYINFENEDIQKVNTWQYNKIRGIRYFTVSAGNGEGGGVYATSGGRVEGCLIVGNTAASGSGIYARGEVITLNNTITDNIIEGSDFTSSAVDGTRTVKVYNSAITGNKKASGEGDNTSGSAYYGSSAVETSSIASGVSNILLKNISEANFADISIGNFAPLEGSKLINAGNTSYVPDELDTDLEGQKRIQDQKITIGAYQGAGFTSINENTTADLRVYPSLVQSGKLITLNLNTIGSDDQQITARIYDLQGRIIRSLTTQGSTSIQAPDTPGIYTLKVSSTGNTVMGNYKLIVTE